jgi:hypothetical protein
MPLKDELKNHDYHAQLPDLHLKAVAWKFYGDHQPVSGELPCE